jgi:hypothetical protein
MCTDSILQIHPGFNRLIAQMQIEDDEMNSRMILITVGTVDAVLSGIVLLIYFGFLPVDISGWDIPRWVVGLIGGVWFASAWAILVDQPAKTNID